MFATIRIPMSHIHVENPLTAAIGALIGAQGRAQQRQHLKNLSAERLDDIGLARRVAPNAAVHPLLWP